MDIKENLNTSTTSRPNNELYSELPQTVNSKKAFGLARKRNRLGSPLYSVRGGSASVPNDAVQGGRSPRIYGFSLHLHQAYAYLMNSKEKFPHLLHQSSITDISRISIYSSGSVIGLFLVYTTTLCVFNE